MLMAKAGNMEQRQKSKQNKGAKLSDRDVQFTNALRKAEVRNSNETKNMRKSIEQLLKEHQQIMKNLNRERTNLVRRWKVRRQESAVLSSSDSQKDDSTDNEATEEHVVKEKEQEVRLPFIKVKDYDQNRGTEESLKKESNVSVILPQTIDKRSSGKEGRAAQSFLQVSDSRFSSHFRKISDITSSSPKMALPPKRSLSISQESGLSHLLRPMKKTDRNSSVYALRNSASLGELRKKESKDEITTFFKTDL